MHNSCAPSRAELLCIGERERVRRNPAGCAGGQGACSPTAVTAAVSAANGGTGDGNRPRGSAHHQHRCDQLPPAQARVGRAGHRHRRGGQAATLAGLDRLPLLDELRLPRRRGRRHRTGMAAARLRPSAGREGRALARRDAQLAGGVGRRLRTERHLRSRHPRADARAEHPAERTAGRVPHHRRGRPAGSPGLGEHLRSTDGSGRRTRVRRGGR